MDNLRIKLVLAYKVPRISNFIADDIKLIKKLNQVLQRLERYNKEQYILEAINILYTLDNVFDIDKLYLVICELVDIKFHNTILYLFSKMKNMKKDDYKKLQVLSNDQDE